jgi:hypothetical protein
MQLARQRHHELVTDAGVFAQHLFPAVDPSAGLPGTIRHPVYDRLDLRSRPENVADVRARRTRFVGGSANRGMVQTEQGHETRKRFISHGFASQTHKCALPFVRVNGARLRSRF